MKCSHLLPTMAHYSYMAKIQEVPNANSGTYAKPLEQVHYDNDDNVFANDIQYFDQSESITNTCVVETGDSNVIPDSPDMCDNESRENWEVYLQMCKLQMTNTFLAIRVSLNRNLSHLSRRYTRYLLTSHSEIVDIE
ncbi:hypothetical protein Tco_0451300 [Tanacetum coccineum]